MFRYEKHPVSLEFKPAKPSLPFVRLVQWVNARILLREMLLEFPEEELARFHAIPAGASIIVAPNHSDSSDHLIILELSRRLCTPFTYMIARETFDLAGGLAGPVLQWVGGFSVNRGGENAEANRFARQVLKSGRFPLVIFPEGEIYFLNDRVMPIKPGVGLFALEVAAEHYRENQDHPGTYILPVAIKYRFREDVTWQMQEVLDRMERAVLGRKQTGGMYGRIYRLGVALIEGKEREAGLTPTEGDIYDRLARLRNCMLATLEKRHLKKEGKEGDLDRARRLIAHLREEIVEVRQQLRAATDGSSSRGGIPAEEAGGLEERSKEELTAQLGSLEKDLEEASLAGRLFSFGEDYLREHPTMERTAETIRKLEREVFHLYCPPQLGRRMAAVRLAPPIDAREFLPEYLERSRRKATILALTDRLQGELQRLISDLSKERPE